MSANERLSIHVFSGPNGAGKTTFAKVLLPRLDCPNFLNADMIAAGVAPLSPASSAITAARILFREWDRLVASGQSFGFETTLSGRTYALRLREAKARGYQIYLYYLWLPTANIALQRIRQRVKKGGHDVPAADVRRRFDASRFNFTNIYFLLADRSMVLDASGQPPKLVVEYSDSEKIVTNDKIYEQINASCPGFLY